MTNETETKKSAEVTVNPKDFIITPKSILGILISPVYWLGFANACFIIGLTILLGYLGK